MSTAISESLVADFEAEAESTRKVLEAVPDDKLDWKPHDKSMTIGALAGHIAESPGWVGSMMEKEMDYEKSMADYKPFVAENRSGLLGTFDQSSIDFKEALAGRNDEFLAGTWTMKKGDQVLMASPRHVAARSMCIHHLIHHRGQLTVYLRMLGVPVPSTYGPTADFPNMM